MLPAFINTGALSPERALIYCRVSSKKQARNGSGLSSQEHRCRQYAEAKGYLVEEVFPDDVTGGGDFMKRPGMMQLLKYLDDHPQYNYVVIFDDLKRYARDVEFHLKLRRAMLERDAKRECLNFNFEDTPEGKFNEIISAAAGELERLQMGRQNRQKCIARIEQGYAVISRPPIGFKYEKSQHGGKILVRDEPLASIVQEALEGYASGRFASPAEIKQFLETQPAFPKDLNKTHVRQQKVSNMLRQIMYAGYVSAPKWGISLRDGKHMGLISKTTFETIQERLNGKKIAPLRRNIHQDFILRGAVVCFHCGKQLRNCWSKGKTKSYAYYLCQNKHCRRYGKSIPRAKIEGDFEQLLSEIIPSPEILQIAIKTLKESRAHTQQRLEQDRKNYQKRRKTIDEQINMLIDRTLEATNATVIAAYEKKIDSLEREKLSLAEKISPKSHPKLASEETRLELSLGFLANPLKTWHSGDFILKRLLLKLAFIEPLEYCKEIGYRTPKISLPFKVLGDFQVRKTKMVPPARETSNYIFDEMQTWEQLLKQAKA